MRMPDARIEPTPAGSPYAIRDGRCWHDGWGWLEHAAPADPPAGQLAEKVRRRPGSFGARWTTEESRVARLMEMGGHPVPEIVAELSRTGWHRTGSAVREHLQRLRRNARRAKQ